MDVNDKKIHVNHKAYISSELGKSKEKSAINLRKVAPIGLLSQSLKRELSIVYHIRWHFLNPTKNSLEPL